MKPISRVSAVAPGLGLSMLLLSSRRCASQSLAMSIRSFGSSQCHMARRSGPDATSPTVSEMTGEAQKSYWLNGSMLIPGTFVPLPLSEYPRNWSDAMSYQWERTKLWAVSTYQFIAFKLGSKPNWKTAPRFKSRRRQIVPTAKALHREMLEAFAAGDHKTLQKICTPQFAKQLGAAIKRRNRRELTSFELVSYNKPLFYPRLKSHLVMDGYMPDKNIVLEQAVVAIASTQKAFKQDADTGATVPGSVKLQDRVEYVVLVRQCNKQTYEMEPWRMWGTTSTTTLEHWRKFIQVANHDHAAKLRQQAPQHYQR
jgi:protein MBA1